MVSHDVLASGTLKLRKGRGTSKNVARSGFLDYTNDGNDTRPHDCSAVLLFVVAELRDSVLGTTPWNGCLELLLPVRPVTRLVREITRTRFFFFFLPPALSGTALALRNVFETERKRQLTDESQNTCGQASSASVTTKSNGLTGGQVKATAGSRNNAPLFPFLLVWFVYLISCAVPVRATRG